ncbi:mandelate racemase/muconate lactonizing enzyme family protein [Alsobacter sp. R-9]
MIIDLGEAHSADPIVAVEPTVLRIPFVDGGEGRGITPNRWNALDIVLLRVETRAGLVGWGEGFGYVCQNATAQVLRDMVGPWALGRDSTDPAAVNRDAQKTFHLFGRHGITIFAISALDIALWDIAAKRRGVSLSTLLGGRARESVRAYASLVRYGAPELVRRFGAKALAEGYSDLKLHEIEEACIAAGRDVAPDATITVDVNCQWSRDQLISMAPALRRLRIDWLEEPTFPPEDPAPWQEAASLGIAVAAGENLCTLEGFLPLMSSLAVVQPSVTKAGGVTEFLRITDAALGQGKRIAPHSPYFGPGYWATLQLAAALTAFDLFEYLYVEPEAWCGVDAPSPVGGSIAIPDTPGIGFRPAHDVIARYRVTP